MAQTITCDRCGEAFPHKMPCAECNSTGKVEDSNCSTCRGKGYFADPNEGKGFKLNSEFEGSPMAFNISLNTFYPDPPDLCGLCMPREVLKMLGEVLDLREKTP